MRLRPSPDGRPVLCTPSLAATPRTCAVLKGSRFQLAANTCFCSLAGRNRPWTALPHSPQLPPAYKATSIQSHRHSSKALNSSKQH